MDVDTSESNVNIGLSSTYSIWREEEKEEVNEEVPEVIVPVARWFYYFTCVSESYRTKYLLAIYVTYFLLA